MVSSFGAQKSTVADSRTPRATLSLELDGHAELLELVLDLTQCNFQRRTPVRARRSLRKDMLALQLEGLDSAFAFGVGAGCCLVDFGLCGFGRSCLGLLFFDAFRFPAFGHDIILRPAGHPRTKRGNLPALL